MQIVIEIDDMAYKFVQNTSFVEDESTLFNQTNADRKKTLFLFDILDAIKNGTALPKGHGRLIDADEFEELFGKECVGDCGACMTKRKTDGRGRWYDTCSLIDISPTIIKADKAGDEG